MKIKSVSASLFLIFWTISSLFAGPSKTLLLEDSISVQNRILINKLFESDLRFTGKMTYTSMGNILLLAEEAVEWTQDGDEDGDGYTTLANLFECDPVAGTVVAAYNTQDTTGDAVVALNDIVLDEADGIYYGLDRENQALYAYEYGPDEEKTVTVEKTRMVEVVVEPEPQVEEEVVQPEPETLEMSEEEESDTAVNDQITDSVTESVEPAAEVTDEVVPEIQAEAAAEVTDEGVEPVAEAAEEEIAEPAEAAVVEEVVPAEPPAPVTKWVEETYEEEGILVVKHKFGKALQQYDLASLKLSSITDLQYDKETNVIVLLGEAEDGNKVIVSIQASEDGSIVANDLIHTGSSDLGDVIFIDKVTKHWVISGPEGLSVYARDGRLLRKTESGMGDVFSDICNVPVLDETGAVSGSQWMVFHYGQVGILSWERPGEANIHHVPGEFVTIQAAVDAAKSDDWVILSPGIYKEKVTVAGKSINLISYYQTTQDLYFIENTVIRSEGDAAITATEAPNTSLYVSGLRLTGSAAGVRSSGNITMENLEIVGNQNGTVFAGGTAVISDCDILNNAGDGVAYHSATATLLEKCNISDNAGHGINIVITPYDGELYRTVIRRNDITRNGGSGIHFEDAPITTQREFRIENNFIIENKVAGVEVFLPQKDSKNLTPTGPRTKNSVFLVNNTIVKNPVGVLRGGNYRMINNIVAGSTTVGIQNLMYHSLVIRNLFWENKENSIDSNYVAANNREEDPMFVGNDYILSVRSPAKRTGIPGNLWNDTSDRSGADIGASK
jgi:hypothetical protein